jgi:hypothetical protein
MGRSLIYGRCPILEPPTLSRLTAGRLNSTSAGSGSRTMP